MHGTGDKIKYMLSIFGLRHFWFASWDLTCLGIICPNT